MAEKDLSLHLIGMTCAACSTRVEKVLNKMEHVDAKVNLATETETLDYDVVEVKPTELVDTIQQIGYDVEMEKEDFHVYVMTCAACYSRIEKVSQNLPGVNEASVNLTTETASVS